MVCVCVCVWVSEWRALDGGGGGGCIHGCVRACIYSIYFCIRLLDEVNHIAVSVAHKICRTIREIGLPWLHTNTHGSTSNRRVWYTNINTHACDCTVYTHLRILARAHTQRVFGVFVSFTHHNIDCSVPFLRTIFIIMRWQNKQNFVIDLVYAYTTYTLYNDVSINITHQCILLNKNPSKSKKEHTT